MSRERKTACRCPFCETPLADEKSFCKPCGATIRCCEKCGKPLPKDATACPSCGARGPKLQRRSRA
jgi:predicted amidophosphoribosyltransferase